MSDVVSLGSVNVDHTGRLTAETITDLAAGRPWFPAAGETVRVGSTPDEFERYVTETAIGGKGANQAVAAAAAGADAAFLGAVGADEADYGVVASLERHGVDVDRVARVDGPTGSAYVLVDETGENRIAILTGANGAVTPAYAEANLDVVRAAGALCVQNETPAETTERVLSRLDDDPATERPAVVFNPAPAAGAGALFDHESLSVVVVNESEAEALAPDLDGVDAAVVRTRGGEAVVVEDRRAAAAREPGLPREFVVSPPAVDPVDTTGAGDVFVGYLAAGVAGGVDLRRAVDRATLAAALSTEREGVQDATPTADEVAAFRTRLGR
jgi:ribokinase